MISIPHIICHDATMDDSSTAARSDVNPYATSPVPDRCDVAWTDGEVEFTEKEIRVRGDFELPRICIHTGATTDLVRREQPVVAVTPLLHKDSMAVHSDRPYTDCCSLDSGITGRSHAAIDYCLAESSTRCRTVKAHRLPLAAWCLVPATLDRT